MRFAIHMDGSFDDDEVLFLPLNELIDRHRRSVGNLLPSQKKNLLPYNLRSDKALRLIGQLSLGVIARSFGKELFGQLENQGNILALEGADRDDLSPG